MSTAQPTNPHPTHDDLPAGTVVRMVRHDDGSWGGDIQHEGRLVPGRDATPDALLRSLVRAWCNTFMPRQKAS